MSQSLNGWTQQVAAYFSLYVQGDKCFLNFVVAPTLVLTLDIASYILWHLRSLWNEKLSVKFWDVNISLKIWKKAWKLQFRPRIDMILKILEFDIFVVAEFNQAFTEIE